MKKSPWKHLSEHPPALVRLFARRKTAGKNVVVMTLSEISIASGMALDRVTEIAQQTSWENVTVKEAERFIAGCNFDPLSYSDRNRKNAYTRACQTTKQPFSFLRKSPLWATELAPLIRRLQSRTASSPV